MRRTRTALLGGLIALALGGASYSRAELDGERFRSEEWRVALRGPKGWKLSEQSSYPSVLLRMVRRSPNAKMLFSAEPVSPETTAQSYAKVTSAKLEELGFRVRAPQQHPATGAYYMDFDNGRRYLRQALLVANETGYSLTLSTADIRSRGQLLRAFDFTLRSIRPEREHSASDEVVEEDSAIDTTPSTEADDAADRETAEDGSEPDVAAPEASSDDDEKESADDE